MKRATVKGNQKHLSFPRPLRYLGEQSIWVLLGAALALAVLGVQMESYALVASLGLWVAWGTLAIQLWRGRLVWRRTVVGIPVLALLSAMSIFGIAPAFLESTLVGLSEISVLVVFASIAPFLWLGQVNLANLAPRLTVVLVSTTLTLVACIFVPMVNRLIPSVELAAVQTVLLPIVAWSALVWVVGWWWSRRMSPPQATLYDVGFLITVAVLVAALWYAPASTLVASICGVSVFVALVLGWAFAPHLRGITTRAVCTLAVLTLPIIWHGWSQSPATIATTSDTLHIVGQALEDRPVAGFGLGQSSEVVARYHEVNPDVYALGTSYPQLPLWASVVVELGIFGSIIVLCVLGTVILLFGYALLVVRSKLSIYVPILLATGASTVVLGIYGLAWGLVYLGGVFLALSWWVVYNTGPFYSRVSALDFRSATSPLIRRLLVLILSFGVAFLLYQLGRVAKLSLATTHCATQSAAEIFNCTHTLRDSYPVQSVFGIWYAPSLVPLERAVGSSLAQNTTTTDQLLRETNEYKHALERLLSKLPSVEVQTLQALLLTRVASTTLDPVQLAAAHSALGVLVASEPSAIEARWWQVQMDYRVARREAVAETRNAKLAAVLQVSSDLVASKPDWRPGQYLRAAVLLDLGRLTEAAAAATLAGAPDVTQADATELLALVLIRQQSESEVARAFEILTELTRGYPTESRYQFELAGLAEKLGKRDVAKNAYQAVVKIPNTTKNPEIQVWQTKAAEAIKLLDAGKSPLKQ
jgi:hypothetical protein